MSKQLVERFVEALGRLEAERDLEIITSLFADASVTGNVVSPEKFVGREGARDAAGFGRAAEAARSNLRASFAT